METEIQVIRPEIEQYWLNNNSSHVMGWFFMMIYVRRIKIKNLKHIINRSHEMKKVTYYI